MGLFKRSNAQPVAPDEISSTDTTQHQEIAKHGEVMHHETASTIEPQKWNAAKAGGGDVAMALFDTPDQIHEPIDPAEERKVVRKIDFMILPYLAVCYAFFYIDKTTLSYAAIFGNLIQSV